MAERLHIYEEPSYGIESGNDAYGGWDPEEIENMYRQVEAEARGEYGRTGGDPFSDIVFIEFESRSGGKGRQRRPRNVTFLRIGNRAFYLGPDGDVPRGGVDTYLKELFPDLPAGENEFEYVMNELRKRRRVSKRRI